MTHEITQTEREILFAIRFYRSRGWDFTDVTGYLATREWFFSQPARPYLRATSS